MSPASAIAASGTTAVEPVAGGSYEMTEHELKKCIEDCAQSQQDNPDETPYDCRAACLEGQMMP